jgi:transcriptional regulator with XRE-family HTH domain
MTRPISRNLVTGRQLRAARVLAGLTQKALGEALGVDERAVRFWERKYDLRPTGAPNDARIEQVLFDKGVILFTEPTPGARLAAYPAGMSSQNAEKRK